MDEQVERWFLTDDLLAESVWAPLVDRRFGYRIHSVKMVGSFDEHGKATWTEVVPFAWGGPPTEPAHFEAIQREARLAVDRSCRDTEIFSARAGQSRHSSLA